MGARDASLERVAITSTSEVYGSALYVPIDEKHPKQPLSPYSASKIASTPSRSAFMPRFNFRSPWCGPFNTYGPRQSDRAIIPTIISQALDPA